MDSGAQRYMVNELDKPVKSLGSDFFVELSIESSGQAFSAPQPWASNSARRPNPLLACFYNDAEGRDFMRAHGMFRYRLFAGRW